MNANSHDCANEPFRLISNSYRRFGVVWVFIVFTLALSVRLGLLVFMAARGGVDALEFPDEQQYWQIAQSIAAGNGMRDELGFQASRMPLFPLALSLATYLSRGVLVARLALALVGALCAVVVLLLAERTFGESVHCSNSARQSGKSDGRRFGTVAVVAGVLTAIDPWLSYSSLLLLTDVPFALALLMLWVVLPPGNGLKSEKLSIERWMLVGFVGAVSVFLREAGLPFLIVLAVFLVARDRGRQKTLRGLGVAAVVFVVALLPWAVRNRMILGEWVWLTTRGGISLYDGVGPQANGASDLGEIKQMSAVAGMSELEWNRFFQKESLEAIQAEPMRVIRLAGTKLARTWNPVPNLESFRSTSLRWLLAAWSLLTLALAAMGTVLGWKSERESSEEVESRWGEALNNKRWRTCFLLVPAACVTLLHSVFVGSVRYRLTAIPFLHILAAVSVVAVVRTIYRRLRVESDKEADLAGCHEGNP